MHLYCMCLHEAGMAWQLAQVVMVLLPQGELWILNSSSTYHQSHQHQIASINFSFFFSPPNVMDSCHVSILNSFQNCKEIMVDRGREREWATDGKHRLWSQLNQLLPELLVKSIRNARAVYLQDKSRSFMILFPYNGSHTHTDTTHRMKLYFTL